jgi:hypothetical protein
MDFECCALTFLLLFCLFTVSPPQLFEIRYIWNLVVNRMDLSLLRVSVLVEDSTKVSKMKGKGKGGSKE